MTTTDTESTTYQAAERDLILHLDPRKLKHRNIRLDPALDAEFIASIKDLGVLTPLSAVSYPDGSIEIQLGQRRTKAAIEVGLDTIPVWVVGPAGEEKTDRILAVLRQWHENEHRKPLTTGEKALAVQQLLDLDVPLVQIQKRLQLPKGAVGAARSVARSETARKAADTYGLNFDQAAGFAEFENDERAVNALERAARTSEGQFGHELKYMREKRDDLAAITAARAKAEASGVRMVRDDENPAWYLRVDELTDADGNDLDPEAHASCPGHAVDLAYSRDDAARYVPRPYCLDPLANGHKSKHGDDRLIPAAAPDPEAAKAAKRYVRAGNVAWRACTAARTEWITTFAHRASPPSDAARFTGEAVARADSALSDAMWKGGHKLARKLLNLPEPEEDHGLFKVVPLTGYMARLNDQRAQVTAAFLIMCAYESGRGAGELWQSLDGSKSTEYTRKNSLPPFTWYLERLIKWGYEPSQIERCLLDGKQWEQPADA